MAQFKGYDRDDFKATGISGVRCSVVGIRGITLSIKLLINGTGYC